MITLGTDNSTIVNDAPPKGYIPPQPSSIIHHPSSIFDPYATSSTTPHQQLQQDSLSRTVDYNSQLIDEREDEVIKIEQSIRDINEIFKDLAVIVKDQGGMVGAWMMDDG